MRADRDNRPALDRDRSADAGRLARRVPGALPAQRGRAQHAIARAPPSVERRRRRTSASSTLQCAWCHGIAGDRRHGTRPPPRKLRHARQRLGSVDDRAATASRGPDMPGFTGADRDAWRGRRRSCVALAPPHRARPLPGNAATRRGGLRQSNGCASAATSSMDAAECARSRADHDRRAAAAPCHCTREALVKPAASHPPGYLVVKGDHHSRQRRPRHPRERGRVLRSTSATQRGNDAHAAEVGPVARSTASSRRRLMPSLRRGCSPAHLDDLVAYLANAARCEMRRQLRTGGGFRARARVSCATCRRAVALVGAAARAGRPVADVAGSYSSHRFSPLHADHDRRTSRGCDPRGSISRRAPARSNRRRSSSTA